MDVDELFERLSNATDRQPIVDEAIRSGVSISVVREMLDYLENTKER